jgi:hypothetical protein
MSFEEKSRNVEFDFPTRSGTACDQTSGLMTG